MLQIFGFTEILFVLVVILLFFGAKRIPEIAGSFGKGINEFKRNLNEAQKQITEPARSLPVRETPWTAGLATIAATWSFVAKTLM